MTLVPDDHPIRFIKPARLPEAIRAFGPGNSISRGEFKMVIPGLLADVEWNHMDQLHRPFIHKTYQENLRIALGRDFAISLTRWGRWPILITVSDSRIAEGIYYQNFVLGGIIFVQNTMLMEQRGESVAVNIEWILTSHWLFKPLHGVIHRMFRKLQARLQKEDSIIRLQRHALRQQGFKFRSDPPDFFNSNRLDFNTIYPVMDANAVIDLSVVPMQAATRCNAGGLEFLVRREAEEVQIWPAVCPHEGADLAEGSLEKNCLIKCSWHGLNIRPAKLSAAQPGDETYGFSYTLESDRVYVSKSDYNREVIHADSDAAAADA